MPVSKELWEYLGGDIYTIYRQGDRLDIESDEGVISWDMEKGEVYVWPYTHYSGVVIRGNVGFYDKVCYVHDDGDNKKEDKLGVIRIDMDSQMKVTEFVSKKEILDILAGEVGIQEKQLEYVGVTSMDYDANCLYIMLNVRYKKGDTLYRCPIVLSRNNEEGSQLKYEKQLTEYIWENSDTTEYPPGGNEKWKTVANEGSCLGIYQGMAYVYFEEKGSVIYDLKTGKERTADWKDKLIFDI